MSSSSMTEKLEILESCHHQWKIPVFVTLSSKCVAFQIMRAARLNKELVMLEKSPPPGASCWQVFCQRLNWRPELHLPENCGQNMSKWKLGGRLEGKVRGSHNGTRGFSLPGVNAVSMNFSQITVTWYTGRSFQVGGVYSRALSPGASADEVLELPAKSWRCQHKIRTASADQTIRVVPLLGSPPLCTTQTLMRVAESAWISSR